MANRQHLYRAKRGDNGEWIEGKSLVVLLHDDGVKRCYMLRQGDRCEGLLTDESGNLIFAGKTIFYEVVPETIGEWTGLEDKNGVKIFEDDIVKTKEYGKVIGYSNVNDYDVFKIVYAPAFFRLENKDREFLLGEYSKHLEVIGNIHDNPELLEV